MTKETTLTVIPALPGWYVAVYFPAWEKGEHSFGFDPIVAWEIERESRPYHHSAGRPGELCVSHDTIPITLDGNWGGEKGNIWAIKTPDGKYEFLRDCTIATEPEALVYARELLMADEDIARKKAEKATA